MRSSPDLLQPRTGPPAWVQDAVAIVLLLALTFGPPAGTEFRAETPLEWVLVLVPIALIPLRRRWPLWVLGACVLMYCSLVLLGIVAPGVALASAIAMFGAANRVDRRAGVISMFVAVALVIAAGLLASLGSTFDPRTVQIVLGLAFAGAAGDATKFRREYLQAVTERRSAPRRRRMPRRGAPSATSACASPATCTTRSRTRSPSSASTPASRRPTSSRVPRRPAKRSARSAPPRARSSARSATCSPCSAPTTPEHRPRSPSSTGSTSSPRRSARRGSTSSCATTAIARASRHPSLASRTASCRRA